MAFNTQQNQTAQNNTDWKAQGFINFYLPDAVTGKPRKLGAVPLKVSNDGEKNLLEWLTKDPANIQKVLKALTIDFHEVKTGAAAGFKLD